MNAPTPGFDPEAHRRWKTEAEFFDSEVYDASAVSDAVLKRYRACSNPNLRAEFGFSALGDLRGKRIFDLGCGGGANSMILAALGAQVTGLDISPKAIAAAQEKARASGLAGRCEFHCMPIELFSSPDQFDILYGNSVLHHLIPLLEPTLLGLKRLVKPGGMYFFQEPLALSATMRRVRKLFPPNPNATPDERPLQQEELAIIVRCFDSVECKYFELFDRLTKFYMSSYENAAPPLRALSGTFAAIDRAAFAVGFKHFASYVAITAR